MDGFRFDLDIVIRVVVLGWVPGGVKEGDVGWWVWEVALLGGEGKERRRVLVVEMECRRRVRWRLFIIRVLSGGQD